MKRRKGANTSNMPKGSLFFRLREWLEVQGEDDMVTFIGKRSGERVIEVLASCLELRLLLQGGRAKRCASLILFLI